MTTRFYYLPTTLHIEPKLITGQQQDNPYKLMQLSYILNYRIVLQRTTHRSQ
jgi:hypothetical protein